MLDFPSVGAANYNPGSAKKHAFFSPWPLAQARGVRSFRGSTGPAHARRRSLLDRHNVPDPAFAIAMRGVGRVMEQGIDRMAAIGPLHLAAIAPDGGPVSQRLGVGRRQDRRMGAVATFIAEGTAGAVL